MKKLLIVVDFQNDFVNGSLGFEHAQDIENHIVNLIHDYHQNGDDVIYTLDTHDENYLQSYEGKHLPIKHCIQNTQGWELYGKTKELLKNDLAFKKSTFPSLDLANYLKDKSYENITLVGLVSNICVISNAIMVKSALPNTPICIDLKGTASFDQNAHLACIEVMKSLQFEIIE